MDFNFGDVNMSSDPFISLADSPDWNDISGAIPEYQCFSSSLENPQGVAKVDAAPSDLTDRLFQSLPSEERRFDADDSPAVAAANIDNLVSMLAQEDERRSHVDAPLQHVARPDSSPLNVSAMECGFGGNQVSSDFSGPSFTTPQQQTVSPMLLSPNYSSVYDSQPPSASTTPAPLGVPLPFDANLSPFASQPQPSANRAIKVEPMTPASRQNHTGKVELMRLLERMSPRVGEPTTDGERKPLDTVPQPGRVIAVTTTASNSQQKRRRNDNNVKRSDANVGVATKLGPGGSVIPNSTAPQTSPPVNRVHASLAPHRRTTPMLSTSATQRPYRTPMPTAAASLDTTEEDNNESDSDDNDANSAHGSNQCAPFKQPNKTERRTAHNLIEKKYRCSINDRINHLKIILAGEDAKLSKSATLKKAIDYIEFLQSQNDDFRRRNEELKRTLLSNGLDVPCSPAMLSRSTSPSNGGSPMDDSLDVDQVPVKQPRRSTASADRRAANNNQSSPPMVDRARVTLFAFMVCLVVLNPLALIIGGGSGYSQSAGGEFATPVKGSGRTLLSVFESSDTGSSETSWWHDRYYVRTLSLWLVNGIVIACILARLLIYAEPVIDLESYSWNLFRRRKAQADDEVSKGNLTEASRQLNECLRVLRRLPSSVVTSSSGGSDDGAGTSTPATAGSVSALLWQLCHYALNAVWIGRWMSRQQRGAVKSYSVVHCYRQTALIYNRLHQLHLLGFAPGGHVHGLTLALSSVNMAHCAAGTMPADKLLEIYCNLAIRAKRSIPKYFGFSSCIEAYFLNCARRVWRHGKGVDVPSNVAWLFHPTGRRFFSDARSVARALNTKSALAYYPFCVIKSNSSSLDYVTAGFKTFLVKELMDYVLNANEKNVTGCRRLNDALETAQLLLETCQPSTDVSSATNVIDKGDELCLWWLHLLTCAVHWSSSDFPLAQRKYQFVRAVPGDLLTDNLALALGHAFCSRKLCFENRHQRRYEQVVWVHCCKARLALQSFERSRFATTVLSDSHEHLADSVRLLVYDWVLASLVDVWQDRLTAGKRYWLQPAAVPLAQLFRDVFTDYRHAAAQRHTWLHSKVLLYEACGRMVSGANPLATWQLLLRCSKNIRFDASLTDLDRARMVQLLQLHDMIAKH